MTLLAPERLALVMVPFALAIAYLVIQRRRSRYAIRFTAVDLLDTVAPDRPGWRRHLPALAYLCAVFLLVVGMARPAMAMEVPAKPTIVLALDVSYSMNATDIAPSRLRAAQDAALRFLDLVPDGVRVGLVSFNRSARALVAPTTDHAGVAAAIDRLVLGPGTAIGDAIDVALEQLPKVAPGAGQAASGAGGTGPSAGAAGTGPGTGGAGPTDASSDATAGSIVLLSDGKTTVGQAESESAARAADRGVPVSTIAFGTPSGSVTVDGQRIAVPVDKEALRAVARTTGGRFFEAASADQLRAVFEDLGRRAGSIREQREVTDLLVGAALIAAIGAALGSLAWFSRLP